ncbi:MAG: S1 RNA-binding domain-containing protein, partial [Fidelibacterota bacterium]
KKGEEVDLAKIGNVYEGIISGVTSFGFFVEITDFLIEGLVNMRDLDDDYYVFDKFLYRLTGTRKKRVFSLGDRVTVKIKAVNVSERKLDLILAG